MEVGFAFWLKLEDEIKLDTAIDPPAVAAIAVIAWMRDGAGRCKLCAVYSSKFLLLSLITNEAS